MTRLLSLVCLLAAGPCAAQALTYSGRLTHSDGSAFVWPHLLFALNDAQGEPLWWTLVDSDLLALTADDGGHFTAVLDRGTFADGSEGPPTGVLAAKAVSLSVASCHVRPCVDPTPLGEPQPLAAVPRALYAEAVPPAAVAWAIDQLDDLVVAQNPGPGEFASLDEALHHLDTRLIPPGREVTIHVRRGVYDHAEPLTYRRADGLTLNIIGEGAGATFLRFPATSGLVIEGGARLGRVNGLSILGGWQAGDGVVDGQAGVSIEQGAFARLGPDLTVSGFGEACISVRGGHASAEGVVVDGCGLMGIRAHRGAVVEAAGASITDGGTYCLHSAWHSSLNCDGCTVRRCRDGAVAVYQSEVSFIASTYDDSISRYVARAQYVSFVGAYTTERPADERVHATETSYIRF